MESLSDPNVKPVISNENVKFTNEVSGQALCWNGNDERYIEFRTRNLERRLENKTRLNNNQSPPTLKTWTFTWATRNMTEPTRDQRVNNSFGNPSHVTSNDSGSSLHLERKSSTAKCWTLHSDLKDTCNEKVILIDLQTSNYKLRTCWGQSRWWVHLFWRAERLGCFWSSYIQGKKTRYVRDHEPCTYNE